MALLRTVAVLAILSTGAVAKNVAGSLNLNSADTEQYLTKFSFTAGASGTVQGKLSHQGVYLDGHPHFLEFYLFDDQAWEKYRKMQVEGSLCRDRVALATHVQKIEAAPDPNEASGHHTMTFFTPVQTPETVRYYYAVIGDCYLEEYDAHPPSIHYDINFVNGKMVFPGDSPDKARHAESELPADEQGLYSMNFWVLLGMSGYLVVFASLVVKQRKESGQVHLVVLLLGLAFLLQMGSVFFEFCHLHVYRQNGKGLRWRHSIFPADFFSECCQGLSELLLSFLLVALASGWTLTEFMSAFGDVGDNKTFMSAFARPAELVRKVTPASIFAACLIVIQVGLELAGRAYEDDFNQFHDMEHLPGHLLQFFRIALCGVFWLGLSGSMKHNANKEIGAFLNQLACFGTLWYLAFPLLVFYSGMFVAPHNRHRVVTVGSIVCQSAAIALLSHLFLGKSAYKKVSSLSRMGNSMGAMGLGGAMGSSAKVCTD